MLWRLAEHIAEVNKNLRHKYRVLHQAREQGIPITFDVLYYAKQQNPYMELLFKEAYYINKYKPPLNYQIPNLDNPKKYKVNKKAKYITLGEILND